MTNPVQTIGRGLDAHERAKNSPGTFKLAALAWLSGLDEREDLFKTLGILVGVGALVIALFTVF